MDASVMFAGCSMIQDGTSTPFQAHTDRPSGYRSAGPSTPCSRSRASPRRRFGPLRQPAGLRVWLQPTHVGRQLPQAWQSFGLVARPSTCGYSRKLQARTFMLAGYAVAEAMRPKQCRRTPGQRKAAVRADPLQQGDVFIGGAQHDGVGGGRHQRVGGVHRALHHGLHALVHAHPDPRGNLPAELCARQPI